MTEDPGTDQQPPKPDHQPPKDDIRWLIYLAIGFVVVLALLLLSGMQSSHMATDQAVPGASSPRGTGPTGKALAAIALPGMRGRRRMRGCRRGGSAVVAFLPSEPRGELV